MDIIPKFKYNSEGPWYQKVIKIDLTLNELHLAVIALVLVAGLIWLFA